VVSSPSSSTFALRETVTAFGQNRSPITLEAIQQGFYVDDCFISVSTEDEAIETLTEMCAIVFQGGFNLTKWLSNNHKV